MIKLENKKQWSAPTITVAKMEDAQSRVTGTVSDGVLIVGGSGLS